MEHTAGGWSCDKLGYGNKDLNLNHQPKRASVEANIPPASDIYRIYSMNDFLLQPCEHGSMSV